MKKRVLCFLMSLIMVFGVLNFQVFAIDKNENEFKKITNETYLIGDKLCKKELKSESILIDEYGIKTKITLFEYIPINIDTNSSKRLPAWGTTNFSKTVTKTSGGNETTVEFQTSFDWDSVNETVNITYSNNVVINPIYLSTIGKYFYHDFSKTITINQANLFYPYSKIIKWKYKYSLFSYDGSMDCTCRADGSYA